MEIQRKFPRVGKKAYIIAHFHCDAAWLKPREEYLQICHHHILEVLQLLRKYPAYCFLLEQVYLIKTFLQRYPEEEAYFRECLETRKGLAISNKGIIGMGMMDEITEEEGKKVRESFWQN